MSSYQFTPQAVEDLFEIWRYIAADDPNSFWTSGAKAPECSALFGTALRASG